MRSLNVRGSYDGMVELGSREEEVDIFVYKRWLLGWGKGSTC